MNPFLKTTLLRTLCFLLWACFSAWLFSMVEYTEKDNKEEKYQLLLSLYESMASKYNMTIEEFNNFSNVAHEALSEPKPQWTYIASMDFVFQAVTTVGYGYITPQTPAGQMLCIFVCLVGIPITMLKLKSAGELIAKWVNTIVTKFEKNILKRQELKHVKTKCAVILFSLMVLFIALNGLLVMHLEDWTFVEGVYFWFVTMTTIGFGDYVPKNMHGKPQKIKQLFINSSKHHINKTTKTSFMYIYGIFLPLYAVICLCIVSSVLNSIMAAMEEQKCRPRCPGCVPRKTQDHADNEQYNTAKHAQREDNVENEEFSVTEL